MLYSSLPWSYNNCTKCPRPFVLVLNRSMSNERNIFRLRPNVGLAPSSNKILNTSKYPRINVSVSGER